MVPISHGGSREHVSRISFSIISLQAPQNSRFGFKRNRKAPALWTSLVTGSTNYFAWVFSSHLKRGLPISFIWWIENKQIRHRRWSSCNNEICNTTFASSNFVGALWDLTLFQGECILSSCIWYHKFQIPWCAQCNCIQLTNSRSLHDWSVLLCHFVQRVLHSLLN